MFLAKLSINRPVMMTMMLLVFIVFGAMAYFGLNLNMMPKVDIPFVTVQTIYPGAGPREIETQVTKVIEDALGTVSRIKTIRSFSMESVAFIFIEFEIGKDIDIANQEIREKVDKVLNDLPASAEKPVISKFEIGSEAVVDLVLSGEMNAKDLYDLADSKLKDRLSQIDGVASVSITGGEKREIRVELDNRTVWTNNISLLQLSQILAAQNMDMPGGNFQRGDQEYSVRLEGEFEELSELANIEIPTANGIKKLGDIAKISDSSEDVRERSIYYDNINKQRVENVVRLGVIKSSDGNEVKVADTVKELLPDIQAELPPGTTLKLANDNSIFTRASVEDTMLNILLGILLTALVLLFFLHDLRSTLIVGLAMPTSIISTFMLMKAAGFSLNLFSLMGISTSVGVLVTNAVVVLENIFRHKEMGNSPREAAESGTSEMTVAVFASTLTNIVVFLPIASMSSLVGQFFKEFGLTVTFATLFSLIISFTLTPMLASLILPEKKKVNKLGESLEKMFRGYENFYRNILSGIIRSRGKSIFVVFLAIVAFVATMFFVAPKVGFEFIPLLDEGNIAVTLELPEGYNLDETGRTVEVVEAIITKHTEVKHVITTIGQLSDREKGTNMAIMSVKLTDAKEREKSTSQINSLLIEELSNIPDAKITAAVKSDSGGENPIELYLKGQDIDELDRLNKTVLAKFKEVPGLINFRSSAKSGKPEITVIPNRTELTRVQASVYDIAIALRASIEGLVTTQYRAGDREYDIRVTMQDEIVNSPDKIAALTISTPAGTFALSQLATLKFSVGVNNIQHVDKAKSISYTGAPAEGVPLGDVQNAMNAIADGIELPPGYQFSWGGEAQMMQETSVDMAKTFALAILLTYMLLAAILESFVQPLYILSTLPLALIGVIGAIYLTGQTMNIFSMMAIIMLVGIVVNNAILLLEYTKQLMADGKNVHDALLEACPTKLKPILMSSLAIILGMLPMALGVGSAGKEFRQSMGIVSIGGLIVSTAMTLFVIPAIFYMFNKEKND